MRNFDSFEKMISWQKAREFNKRIYLITESQNFKRDFDLLRQIRRASISISSNIAEGFESRTQALFIEFLGKARGSAGELRSQLFIALDRKYISEEMYRKAFTLTENCSKKLARFIQYLESRPNSRRIGEERTSYEIEPSTF